jgi:hypothetical protein
MSRSQDIGTGLSLSLTKLDVRLLIGFVKRSLLKGFKNVDGSGDNYFEPDW